MKCLILKNQQVIHIRDVNDDYVAKIDEVLINEMPAVKLNEDERALIFYRNGEIQYEIRKR